MRKLKLLLTKKKKHINNNEKFVVVNEFDYKQLFKLIILYINTILLKINFNFFIRNFILIIDFKMLNNKKVILNV